MFQYNFKTGALRIPYTELLCIFLLNLTVLLQLLLSLGDYYAEIPPLRNTEALNARS